MSKGYFVRKDGYSTRKMSAAVLAEEEIAAHEEGGRRHFGDVEVPEDFVPGCVIGLRNGVVDNGLIVLEILVAPTWPTDGKTIAHVTVTDPMLFDSGT